MNAKIDHINRYVSDVNKFVEFYSNVLEYQLISQGNKENGKPYAILRGNEHELFISEKDEFSIYDSNFRHLGYSVEDADLSLEKLKRLGIVKINEEIIIKEFSRQFYVKDPDGFEIDLIQWTDKDEFYKSLI